MAGIIVSTWNGIALPAVVITVRGTTLAAQTDANGRYELKNVPPGDQVLRFSKSGYASVEVKEVRVLPGQTSPLNANMRPEFYDLEEYTTTAEVITTTTEKILFERKGGARIIEGVGQAEIAKSGAADASAIVTKVTGVSVVGGKYAVVRGLSDRYTRTMLNGVEVPSADPYRASPQLDLFPAGMIDRISISKTFTPDQPGASGGGTIDIITKPFPEKAFIKASIGTSYNPDSNLKKNFLADPKTSTSMLDLPSAPEALDPQFFLLKSRLEKPNNAVRSETLARAQMRRGQADDVSRLLQSLGTTDFSGVEKTSPLNSSMSASAGKTFPVFHRPFGVFAAVNYSRNFRLLSDYEVGDYTGILTLKKSGRETRSNSNTDYGANVNLGYELSQDHQIGFNFMLAHSVDEEARHSTFDVLEGREGDTLEKWQLHFTEREIQNYQVHGHHRFPFLLDSKLDWTVSLAHTTQDEPNHRFMNYFLDPAGRATFGDSSLPVPQNPSRYFREIEEDSLNAKADYTLPLSFMKQESKFKMGFFNSTTDRSFREQYFGYSGSSGFDPNNPNTYLNNPAFLNYVATHLPPIPANSPIGTNYSFQRFVELVIGRPYEASQEISAGYPMLDLGVVSWLRLIGGVRVERTFMEIITRDAGSSMIDQLDLLPAAGAVISFTTNIHLRLSYTETVARPSFREKAPISNYLPDLDLFADGNRDLQMSAITSYDARLEWFPGPGDIVSVGVFYKDIKSPIELYRLDFADSVTWINRESATLMGVEFEARKSLDFITKQFKGLTIGANVAIIESETEFTPIEFQSKTDPDRNGIIDFKTGKTRSLYDQSPYIINLDLSYEHPTYHTALTIAANFTAERIILTTAQGPDIYEHSPVGLDALISQKLGKIWTLRFGVKNILNDEYRQTFGKEFESRIRQAYRRGRAFSFAVTGEF